ncbi:TPA: SOS response-associated peptidase [Legionella pneumophila]|uniref:Abasic site processing protein n=1 Tax=Legionella pneumophila subsp. pneumophila TaxID=91891 RepID=A0A3A6U007_LEGPN|nr:MULTISPECIES: SOS response-associated peptidase [Legionella]HAT7809703.1 SOS response-associated peptidase [Legionella pneumophila]MBN5936176.1 SOS response-associated peptidase [Legionella anisa]RJY24242.1 SOS response-associated peptidase [Legionella pneumophila subsp. pneumophila]RJY24689.1 SOS response-associated peptidase [Legionella pneumophila subsp. pneumophila]HAU1905944.1 SOS response-associated peptidase [Legionella pneumophila]
MCGRFAYVASNEELKSQFHPSNAIEITPRFNIAPGSQVLCLVKTDEDEVQGVVLHWGFIPSWATDRKKFRNVINARAETIFEKPAFRQVIKSKRCLMPMSGFYEWHQENDRKQPYFFQKKNHELLAVAALWDTWGHDEEVLHSCCLITTDANPLMQPVHHRMPVILDESEQEIWLNNTQCVKEQLMALLKSYPYNDLEGYRVSALVNKTSFDHPLAIRPLSL